MIRKIFECCVIIIITGYPTFTYSQNYFNILPDVGGIDMQGQAWAILVDMDQFYVLGDRIEEIDSSGAQDILPWFGSFSYDGDIKSIESITSQEYVVGFSKSLLQQINDSIVLAFESVWDDSLSIAQPVLIQFNKNTGSIIRSYLFHHPLGLSKSLLTLRYALRDNGNCLASALFYIDSKPYTYVVEVDGMLNLINDYIVDANNRYNNPYYMKSSDDSTTVFIGSSFDPEDPKIVKDRFLFFMETNIEGEILKYQTTELLDSNSYVFPTSISYTVLKEDNGNWIISCGKRIAYDDCVGCFKIIPVTLSLSHDFSNLLWKKEYPELAPFSYSQPIITALEKAKDGSGYITVGFDTYSFLYKTSEEGDSLWTKKYIPDNWDIDRLAWCEFIDVKITDSNDILIAGKASDNLLQIVRPWILLLDEDGCLVPKCDTTSVIHDSNNPESINIYPNPAGDYLTIEINDFSYRKSILTINNDLGQTLYTQSINLYENYAINLPFEKFNPGVYYINLSNAVGLITKLVVKQ